MAQAFGTLPVGLGSVFTLYQLSIRAPGNSIVDMATYTFPISPSQVRMDRPALSTFSDTQGPPISNGVTRVIDTYGLGPPIYTIEGTTGWDYHSSDGYLLTGLQSVKNLNSFLAYYATLNQQQRAAGNPNYYTLEFYDFFTGNFWQVEPVGPQTMRQSADRPTLTYYRFHWAASVPAGKPLLAIVDALLNLLNVPRQESIIATSVALAAFTANYQPFGVTGLTL